MSELRIKVGVCAECGRMSLAPRTERCFGLYDAKNNGHPAKDYTIVHYLAELAEGGVRDLLDRAYVAGYGHGGEDTAHMETDTIDAMKVPNGDPRHDEINKAAAVVEALLLETIR